MDFDLYIERDFLDSATRARLVNEMRAAHGAPATVYGRGESGAVDERVRLSTRVAPSREMDELVRRLLLDRLWALNEHFRITLSEMEEPQYLRYEAGGYFVAHQDGNTGLLRSERELRKVSVVVFVNQQTESREWGEYCGGALVFHPRPAGKTGTLSLAGEPGTLVAFRAETTHEVEPITHGERFTIACWYK